MLAVEATVRAYARKFGEDEELWGRVGLLHDFDYERYPDAPAHPLEGSKILRERVTPKRSSTPFFHMPIICKTSIRASHFSTKRCTRVMSCLIYRSLRYPPPPKLEGLTASSVRKKMKTQNFAAAVSREGHCSRR